MFFMVIHFKLISDSDLVAVLEQRARTQIDLKDSEANHPGTSHLFHGPPFCMNGRQANAERKKQLSKELRLFYSTDALTQ
jgi:hypothetical protein